MEQGQIGGERTRWALACAFRIPTEGFAVADFAADLVGAATVFFAADRVGAIVFFFVAWADLALLEVFAVGLCPCSSEPAFFSLGGRHRIGLGFNCGSSGNSQVLKDAFARFLSEAGRCRIGRA